MARIRQIEHLTKVTMEDVRKHTDPFFLIDIKRQSDLIVKIAEEIPEALKLKDPNWWSWAFLTNRKKMDEYDFIVSDSLGDVLSDIVVRIMILASTNGIDLEEAIKARIKYNQQRRLDYGKERD